MSQSSHTLIPSALETQLLRAALLDGDPAREAYRSWRAEVDIDALDGGGQRVLPLLSDNLGRLGVEDDLVPFMRGHRRQAVAANAHRIRGARDGLQVLADAGIEVLALKGTALVASGLSELGLRPIGDVDVLVHADDRAAAIDALVGAGWETDVYPSWYLRRTFYRECPAWVWRHAGVELDLHWGALHLVRDPVAEAPLWQRARPADVGGVPVLVPSAEDQAMHAWLHASEYNPVAPLRWAADAFVAIRSKGDDFDWDICVDTAVAQRVVVQTRAAVEYLADALDVPVPKRALDRLRIAQTSRIERREHLARNRPPERRGRIDRTLVTLQDHRRQDVALLERSAVAGALDLWRGDRDPVDGRELHDVRQGPLVLDRDQDPLDSLIEGWSFPEPIGRWTVGRKASLALNVEPEGESLLVAELSAFVGSAGRRQRVTVHVNGRRYARLRFGAADLDLAPREVRIPVPASPDGTVLLSFAIGSPRSPSSIGLPADDRQLGMLLRSVRLA